MHGKLVLTIFTVQSSYLQNTERPLSDADSPPDTIQWWLCTSGSWRIRTFAIDHDIHTYSLGNAENLEQNALAVDRKNYGDVIQSQHIIEFVDVLDEPATASAFRAAGLQPHFEVAPGRFLFWKPDTEPYCTQSEPK